jgi:monoamine oxidase
MLPKPRAPQSPNPLPVTTRLGTPSRLRAAVSLRMEARRRGMPAAELAGAIAEEREATAERTGNTLNRRQLLTTAGALAAASTIPGGLLSPSRANAATAPRVVIVGAGLAGLRTAHQLWTGPNPVAATVYEADTSHIGGRCWSLRGFFNNGQVHEHGGAFISSSDTSILNLAKRFHVNTELANAGALKSGDFLAWVNNAPYPSFDADIGAFMDAITASYNAMGVPRYNNFTAEAQRLDNMSCIDYMNEIGMSPNSPVGQLVQTFQLQGAGEPRESSACGLVGFWGAGAFGSSNFDELYHFKGGNDQIISGMLGELPAGTVKQGYELVAVKRNTSGSYTATFNRSGTLVDVVADHLVLALPFRMLRLVDLSCAGLSARKTAAITQQGMGHNAKLVLQLTKKTWPAAGSNGVTNTGPSGYQSSWDGSVEIGANGSPALLVNFPGGDMARYGYTGAAHGPAPSADIKSFLDQIEKLLPGTWAAFNGKAYEDHWSNDRWHYGSYHYYGIGQYTAFAGYEGAQEGRIHFAGEHTDVDNATLNSAVASGERVATEVAAQI